MENKSWQKCEVILTEFRPSPGRAEFVRSVQSQIEKDPDVFPTEAQQDILDKMYRTLAKENMSEVEKQAREFLGMSV